VLGLLSAVTAVVATALVWSLHPAHASERRQFGASTGQTSPRPAALTPIGATVASFGPTGVPGSVWEDRARGQSGEMEEPITAIQRAMAPAGGFRPSADLERWLTGVRIGRTDAMASGFSDARRTQHFWSEWDTGGAHLRGSLLQTDTERRISTSLLSSPWQAVEFATVRGRPADTPWSDTAVRSFRYTTMETAYAYREPGWNVRAAATYSSTKTDAVPGLVDAASVKRFSQSLSSSYRLTPQWFVDSKLEVAPGQIDLPALAVSAEYQPEQRPDLSMSLGCSYGYGRYGLLEPGATTARGALQWRPEALGPSAPTVTFETGYRRAGDGVRPDTRNEDLAALLTLRLSQASWQGVVHLVRDTIGS
jgi:hypothetical protein